MPKAHQRHLEWSPERLIAWAHKTGESTAVIVQKILESRPHPEQGYRSCLGLLRLGKTHGPERLEAACRRAVALKAYSYPSVDSILKKKLETEPLPAQLEPAKPHTKGFERRLKAAKLRQAASPEDIDLKHPCKLDSSLVRALASSAWVRDKRNLLITGPTGVGKTFIAVGWDTPRAVRDLRCSTPRRAACYMNFPFRKATVDTSPL